MGKCRKKPIDIDYRGPLKTSEMVTTAHGRVRAESGDYVLSNPATGDTWPIKPDIFDTTYDVLHETAAPEEKK